MAVLRARRLQDSLLAMLDSANLSKQHEAMGLGDKSNSQSILPNGEQILPEEVYNQDGIASQGSWVSQQSWVIPETLQDARPLLPKAAFFMGDLRDGLPMLNMQAAYLISAKGYSEKQLGALFLAYGTTRFLCMAPVGYMMDYSNNKINWVIAASVGTSALTVLTAVTSLPRGENLNFMLFQKVLQGCFTAVLPTGFNAITLGIVGSSGFTFQVSRNRMMNHAGTALVVATGSVLGYFLYSHIGVLFIVSPLATIGVYWNLVRIKPTHIDRDAARGLIVESPTMTSYDHLEAGTSIEERRTFNEMEGGPSTSHVENLPPEASDLSNYSPPQVSKIGKRNNANPLDPANNEYKSGGNTNNKGYASRPSFNFFGRNDNGKAGQLRASSPLNVLLDPTLVIYTCVVFFFHLANSAVLPLVMQTFALDDHRTGMLLSGLCIVIGQICMSFVAKFSGDYSSKWGRKRLVLLGLFSLSVRCLLLTILIEALDRVDSGFGALVIKGTILSTQLLDSLGAGICNTLHIIITNDISCRTGRFSLMLGVTAGAMCFGATVSGYVGQAIAEDYGYGPAFSILGCISLVPLFIFMIFMPETLPNYVRPKQGLYSLLKQFKEESQKSILEANPFRRNTELESTTT
eukprot:scaffold22581_cov123-Cylindrotheca_fusiformis.AAC.2